MAAYVYTTASCDNWYCVYDMSQPGRPHSVIRHKVFIKGGANVAPLTSMNGPNIVTPRGVVTKVTDEQLKILEQSKGFQRHVAAGFVTVEKTAKDVDKVVVNMQARDGSAPVTKETLGNYGVTSKTLTPVIDKQIVA